MKMKINHNLKLTKKDVGKGIKIPNTLTSDLAYLVGVFAGDGSIGYRPNKYEYSLKCVGNPKDEVDFYKKIIKPKFKKIFGINILPKKYDSDTTFGFRIFSKTIFLFLTKYIGLPIGKKYNKLKIPKIILKNKKFTISFIRGVFDTDGSISFKKRNKYKKDYPVICLTSKSSIFLKEIANKLTKFGFRVTANYDYKQIDKRIKKGYTIISRIYLNGDKNLKKWNKEVIFFSPKHIKKIQKNK